MDYAGTPLESDYEKVKRRRAIMSAIQERAMKEHQNEIVSGRVVPFGIGEGLAQLGQAWIANKGQNKLDEQEKALGEQFTQGSTDAVKKIKSMLSNTSAAGPQRPDTLGASMSAATDPYLQKNKALQDVMLERIKAQTGSAATPYFKPIYDKDGNAYSFDARVAGGAPVPVEFDGNQIVDPRYDAAAIRNRNYQGQMGTGGAEGITDPLTEYRNKDAALRARLGMPPANYGGGAPQPAAPQAPPQAPPATAAPQQVAPALPVEPAMPEPPVVAPPEVSEAALEAAVAQKKKAALDEQAWNKGSPEYLKNQRLYAQDKGAYETVQIKTSQARKKIDEILSDENKDAFNMNFGGYNAMATQYAPIGDTQTMRKKIDSVKSDLKQAGLEMIRSGGSIGQMTEKEWPIVEQMIETISPVMSEEAAREAFNNVITYMDRIEQKARNEYENIWIGTPFLSGEKPDVDPPKVREVDF